MENRVRVEFSEPDPYNPKPKGRRRMFASTFQYKDKGRKLRFTIPDTMSPSLDYRARLADFKIRMAARGIKI